LGRVVVSGEGLSDDQGSLIEAGIRNRREERDGGENGEKLGHLSCSFPVSVVVNFEMPRLLGLDAVSVFVFCFRFA
jgi:hypothetical protein